VALLLRIPVGTILPRLRNPDVGAALRLSLLTSVTATVVVVLLGLPAAYLLATRRFPGKRLVDVLIDLPMVLPPTVAGFAMLLAFGRMGLLGRQLEAVGITLPFTMAAVVVAQVFMALPFFVSPCRAAFASVDQRYVDAAATLRAGEGRRFLHVVLPLTLRTVVAAAAMACARALGEFGATITFAGNLPGRTQTMPLAVYVELQGDFDTAVLLSLLLVIISFALLLVLRAGSEGLFWRRAPAERR
jgi:molybdate transport system permease protein